MQLYLLRSERNFGIGDFSDLAAISAELARRDCDVVGLNPLHAPFPDAPEHASPYSPASRLLVNPLYIDVTAAPETRGSPTAAALLAEPSVSAELEACRAANTLEYTRVATVKARVLELAFADWRRAGATRELDAFRAAQGTSFERHCLYFALRAHMLAAGLGPGDWHGWPQPYQDSRASVVARFAATHAEEVTRVAWQQWLADRQLAAAAEAAGDMRVGLYRDLAVGSDAAGAETWAERDLMVEALRIGAPPDELSANGQEWGLPPPHPERMRAGGYRAFCELLRANMRHAGALRIDHVMALERLYVIPKGAPPKDGAYLAYPFADLTGIVALESSRRRCIVIGEDLGLVPRGFRERAAAANILSYRVLRFERDAHRFFGPHEYPRLAVAVFSNHDLPTLRGWWQGADFELEHEHGVLSGDDLAAARQRRDAERRALLELLHREGLLPGWVRDPTYEELFGAVHALLGRTRAVLEARAARRRVARAHARQRAERPAVPKLAPPLRQDRRAARGGTVAGKRRGGARRAAWQCRRAPSFMTAPLATYRLQLNSQLGFTAAAALAPYLRRLGVTHVYTSPILKARPGSTHGYDIVAHDTLNPELGDSAQFDAMVAAFSGAGLKILLDFVPNHMGVGGADNPLWLDVLEWGPESAYAGWFDIDWEPHRGYLHDKLLVPVLGDQYGIELDAGKLVLKLDEAAGELAVWAYDHHKLPICPLTYGDVLGSAHPTLERLGDEFGALPQWKPQVGGAPPSSSASSRQRHATMKASATRLRRRSSASIGPTTTACAARSMQ